MDGQAPNNRYDSSADSLNSSLENGRYDSRALDNSEPNSGVQVGVIGGETSSSPQVKPPTTSLFERHRGLIVAFGTFCFLLMLSGIVYVLWSHAHNNSGQQANAGAPVTISSTDLSKLQASGVNNAQRLNINGTLQINKGLVLTPSSAPNNAVEGQIYLDSTNHQLYYYDGSGYVSLTPTPTASGVSSLGGATGDLNLGDGLTTDGLTITNTGVLSLNGLAGGLTLANASSGDGVTLTIDDATATTKGIASFDPTNLLVSGGAVTTVQNINTGATPTFAGVNTNSINPSGALTVGSTGQTLTLQGSGLTTLSATSGSSTTVLAFQSPTANVTYRLPTAAAGTYDICTTVGNCGGGGTGNVNTSGGTPNSLAKFVAGGLTIADSNISDDGSLVSINSGVTISGTTTLSSLGAGLLQSSAGGLLSSGAVDRNSSTYFSNALTIANGGTGSTTASGARSNLGAASSGANSDITSLSGLTTALSVNQGGTGAISFTGNGVLFGNGSGAVQATAAGTSGQILLANNLGIPTFTTVSGDITISNAGVTTIGAGKVTNANLVNSSLTVTAGTGLTGGGSVALGSSTTLNVAYGSSAGTAVQGNTTLVCPSGSGNLSGGGNTITLGSGGTCSGISLTSTPSFDMVTLGNGAGTTGQLILRDGSTANLATLQLGSALSGAVTYNLPASSGTQTICTVETGNCAGSGTGVTTSGTHTQNYVTKFNNAGGTQITNSSIYNDATGVSVGGSSPAALFNVGATNQFQVSSTGAITGVGLNAGTGLIQGSGGLTIGGTITFSSLSSGGGQCLTTNGSGVLSLVACLSGAGGGSGGVVSLNGLSGSLNINNASGAGSSITIDSAKADGSTKGIAAFNATNFSDNGSGVINTIQGIATTATPTFAGLTLNASGLTAGGTITFNGSNFSTDGIITSVSGVLSSGTINLGTSGYLTGTLGVGKGGTGLSSLTSNSLLYASNSSTIGQISNGTTGQCLVATTGSAPSFQTCTGAGGVSSITANNTAQTGALQFNGTSNQVSVTNTGTTFTFAAPQDIGTSSNVNFGTVNAATLLRTNGTTRIDASGNLSNIGTINTSGLITGGNGLTISAGTITLNNLTGGSSKCLTLDATNVVGVATCSTGSGTTPTLQDVYDNSTSGSKIITLASGATNGIAIQDASTPLGANLLSVKNNNATTTYFGVTATGTTVNGTLNVSGAVTLSNLGTGAVLSNGSGNITSGTINLASGSYVSGTLAIGNGGTGASSFANTNGVIYYNGSALTSTTAGTTGQCLLGNTSGAPSFGTCTGAGGVSSITANNTAQTGALQFNGTSNQVSVTNTGTTFTLATPQDINTGSDVTFNSVNAIIKTGGTTRVDASGNLSNIGTISTSGLITGGNGLTISAGTITLNNLTGGTSKCLTLDASNVVGVATCSTGSGATPTLQDVYDNSTSGSKLITLATGATNGLVIQDASTPVGANLFSVKSNGGGTTYLGVTAAGTTINNGLTAGGTITFGGLTTGVVLSNGSGVLSSGTVNLASSSYVSGTLAIGNGGTNATSFANTNGVTYYDGSKLTVTAAGSTNQCLLGNTGSAPSFGTCTGAGGVSSITASTTQTGALTFNGTANRVSVSNSGTTFTFSGPQDIASGSTPTFAGLTLNGALQGTTATLSGANTLSLGTAGTSTGSIKLFNGTGGSTGSISFVAANPGASNFTITVPAATGTICLDSGNCLGGAGGGANTALSNLVSTSVNQSLIANANNSLDLGSSGTAWRTGYFGTQVQTALVDSISGALAIGTTNATSINLNQNINIANGKSITFGTSGNFDQSASSGTFKTGTGSVNLNGATTASSGVTLTNGGSLATQMNADFTTTGTSNNVNLGAGSLVRLTGASAQTITGISGGVNGRILTIVNAGSATATISNLNAGSTAINQITTGVANTDLSLPVGASTTLIYDSGASLWRVTGSNGGVTNVGAISGTSTANGATISGTTITLTAADGTNGGVLTNAAQTIAGLKTFQGGITSGNINTTAGQATSLGNATGNLTVTGNSSSTFVINGQTVDAAEFNRLDGKDAALVDVNDSVATAIVGTGVLSTGSIASGFGTISTGNNISTTAALSGGTFAAGSSGQLTVNASGNLATSGTIQGSTATLTGTNSLTLGTASSSSGTIAFKSATGTGSVTLAISNGASSGNYTLSIPAISANDTICLAAASNCSATGTAGGDLTGTYPNPTIAKLQGNTVTTSSVATGQVLYYNGSAWINTGSPTLSGNVTVQGTLTTGSSGQLQVDASGNITTSGTYNTNTFSSSQLLFGANSAASIRSNGTNTLTVDTGGAAQLNVGTTNANAISISKAGVNTLINGTLTATQLLTANGGVTIATGQNFINGGSTLNAAGSTINLTGSGSIGSAATTVDVATTFNISTNAASYALTIPSPTTTTAGRLIYVNNVGSNSFTLSSQFGGGGSVTVNAGASSSFMWNGTTWTSTAVSTGVSLVGTFSLSSQPNGASISGNTITFGPADGTNPGMVTTGTQSFAGAKTFTGATTIAVTSANAFTVANAASANIYFKVDTSGSAGTITFGDTGSSNYAQFTASGGYIATGTARHKKSITLTPEYAGAVLDAASDASCSGANNGIMTSGYDETITPRSNYYRWSGNAATQCYDVVVQVAIPSDFDGWTTAASGTDPINVQARKSGTGSCNIQIIYSNSTTVDANYNYATCGTLGASFADGATSDFAGNNTTNYVPGGYFTIKIRMTASSASNTDLGNITLNYFSKF